MDRVLFEDLGLKEPGCRLETVRFCTYHGEQTAEMLKGVEQILLEHRPKLVLVGGDANTNLAGALAARKLHLKVGHIEAGERSFDWSMPEEHNRVIIDHISDYLFATGEKARANLLRESVRGEIYVTGNPIVDACYQNLEIARRRHTAERYGVRVKDYVLVTLHREENTDNAERLKGALAAVQSVGRELGLRTLMFAHPRTRRRIEEFELPASALEGIQLEEPVGYLDFLDLLASAALVCTDSGGVQQEACILRVPAITLRDNTEWTETLEIGANVLAGVDPDAAVVAARSMINRDGGWMQPFGDGACAGRIIDIAQSKLG
jgi:UDP-N-acetylglucosamine 2-epimerase (non-hydrolysing)